MAKLQRGISHRKLTDFEISPFPVDYHCNCTHTKTQGIKLRADPPGWRHREHNAIIDTLPSVTRRPLHS